MHALLTKAVFVLVVFQGACGSDSPTRPPSLPDRKPDAGPAVAKLAPTPDGFWEAFDEIKTLEDCRDFFERFPGEFLSAEMFLIKGRKEDRRDQAIKYLEEILASRKNHPHVPTILAAIRRDEQGLLRSIERYVAQGRKVNEATARMYLALTIRRNGRLRGVREHLDKALVAAKESGRRGLVCKAQRQRARYFSHVHDYVNSFNLFKELETGFCYQVEAMGLRPEILTGLANTASMLGYDREAYEYFRRALGERMENEALIRVNLADLARGGALHLRFSPEKILDMEMEAMESARRSRNVQAEAVSHLTLGDNWMLSAEERVEHLSKAMSIYRRADHHEGVVSGLAALAETQLDQNPGQPEEAFATINQAINLSRSNSLLLEGAVAWSVRAVMRWRVGPREQAVADSLSAIGIFESLRDQQQGPVAQARVSSAFIPFYRFFSGRLLDSSGGGGQMRDRDLGFLIAERMRARILLRALQPEIRPDLNRQQEPSSLQAKLVELQKWLMLPDLSADERELALAELEKTERQIFDARYAQQHGDRLQNDVAIPPLTQVQEALSGQQALIAFQIEKSSRQAMVEKRRRHWLGGSWVQVVTANSVRVYPIPDHEVLAPVVEMFLGLIWRRDASDGRAGAVLYRHLLAAVLLDLPDQVSHLVVVPDDPLFQLPFGALRSAPDQSYLATKYRISVLPSATVWLHLQKSRRQAPRPAVLALANPRLSDTIMTSNMRSAGIFHSGLRLGHLPHASDEARAIVEQMGDQSLLIEGPQASEHFLKQTRLNDYGVLHFAAHAVVDEINPHRSAVVLAPGAANEDGLLQVHEISRLDLDGQIVILSTCSSAKGELIEGEGVMSLARAFFQAGARAVIGNLWPLRDDEASEMVSEFSQKLGRGASLGEALHSAKRDWIRAGKPPAAWAGLCILGDTDLVVSPADGPASSLNWRYLLVIVGGLLALLAGWMLWRRVTDS